MNEWWRKAVVYQIYPKSFNDTTGDGIGDLRGVIEKLDYLAELGVDVLWLTPVYASPQRDNGYDISDYRRIHEAYGTMEDFEELLREAHARGLKVMMDMVVNHTSTDHPWFQQARRSKDNPRRNFYIWKKGRNDGPPTNWLSKFGGSAWKKDERTGEYYLHLFDVTQADLNWEYPPVREEVYDMMRWWLDKGVDGFRLDVINLISKDQRFPDDPEGDGRPFYTDGPRIHEYLQEMNREVFSKYDMVTVGEMSSTSISECIQYTRPNRRELDMTFQFHHLKVDYPNGEKWAQGDMDFLRLKRILAEWQTEMHAGGGWNALFWCNHDQPRIVSRYGDDGLWHTESAKMLATVIHLMQGTPYIYQGEEFGMTNPQFVSIDEYRDVETHNMYRILLQQGKDEEEVMKVIREKSRDNARTPMQWDNSKNAGFTDGTPWIGVAHNYATINAERALSDSNSIFYHYKELIRLRKTYDIVTTGGFQLLLEEHPDLFAYLRNGDHEKLLVVNNFRGHDTVFTLPREVSHLSDWTGECLLSNYADSPTDFRMLTLRPYESVVYRLTPRSEAKGGAERTGCDG
ncbi:alpha,alpha-phosphotrehalase [Melghirimyces algeriensis]|uniref:Alpha,alpha-phosphotrehalase n=1 Tax=Melghirimyces algeriensis TaxID=910412 RepID=A0A521ATG0_9BACL|nr:alpha,alpha-phosphotrehalase [Melghirimyces algeriensis]SMO38112.1 trehalose-6-phosphate hydrolase [Melghirimyces algeriensis]